MSSTDLDGGDVEGRGDAEHRHDDRLVLLVDVDLHVSDLLFSGHLGHVFVGHIGFSGSGRKREETLNFWHMSRRPERGTGGWGGISLAHKAVVS